MIVQKRYELWGHRLEFAGVVVVMFATFWQAGFSDWWKDQLGEWQFYIQEEVNLSLLYSVQNLAELDSEMNPQQKAKVIQRMRDDTARTVQKVIDDRKRREHEIKSGQSAVFFRIRDSLLVVGAVLFAVGKWMLLAAARGRTAETRSFS